jgi:membrane associated rhomboid family serine protease
VLPIGVSGGPLRRRPWVTAVLVLVVVGLFLRSLLLRGAPVAPYCTDLTESVEAVRRAAGTVQALVCRYGAIPDELRRGEDLQTLVTATFLHSGWLHLVGNLAFLVAFAPRVEQELGGPGLLVLYLGGSVVGTAVHVLAAPESVAPAIGSSGAVAAVLGAHLLVVRDADVRTLVGPVPMRLPSWFVIGFWAVQQTVATAVVVSRAVHPGGAAFEAHVAGLLVGAAIGAAVLVRRRSNVACTGAHGNTSDVDSARVDAS